MSTQEAHIVTDSLWGDLPDVEEGPTPRSILRQQANALTSQTRGVLSGEVETTVEDGHVVVKLLLVAPYLGNYEVEVVSVWHSATFFYPLTVTNLLQRPRRGIDCNNIEEFKVALAKILQSKVVHRAIAALLAQSQT